MDSGTAHKERAVTTDAGFPDARPPVGAVADGQRPTGTQNGMDALADALLLHSQSLRRLGRLPADDAGVSALESIARMIHELAAELETAAATARTEGTGAAGRWLVVV